LNIYEYVTSGLEKLLTYKLGYLIHICYRNWIKVNTKLEQIMIKFNIKNKILELIYLLYLISVIKSNL